MVLAARRAYRDAVRWTVEARPPIHPPLTARRLTGFLFFGGCLVLGLIGMTSPSSFGDPGAGRGGPQWWGAGIVVLIAALVLAVRARVWLRPLRYRFDDRRAVGAAADALRSAPAPFRTRYAAAWIWLPVGMMTLAALLAASAAYFLIDAVLARFSVTWQGPVIGLVDFILAFFLLLLAAPRIWTVRFAADVNREARG